jgi:hypothetical protein
MNELPPTCSRCESALAYEDLRCPVCLHATDTDTRADAPDVAVEVMRCSSCGASVTYSVREMAPSCAFCGSVTRVEVSADPIEQTEHYLPFVFARDRAADRYRRWLRHLGWFRPSDLGSSSALESIKPLWWVGWVVNADATVSWTADSNAGSRRADWAPHAGRAEIPYQNILIPASRGLSPEETSRLAPSYDLSTATESPKGVDGQVVVEQFEVPRSSARARVRAMLEQIAAERLRNGHIPGRRFRNLHTSVMLRRLVRKRFAFPAYVLAYRYRGRLYRVVISGQDESCLIGTAPYSMAKILTVVFGGLAAMLLLVGLIAAL